MPPAGEKTLAQPDMRPPGSTGPGIYMPRVQFGIRIMLSLLSAVYFFALPVPTLFFSPFGVGLIVTAYIIFHVAWWCHYRLRGAGSRAIRLAALVDVAVAYTGVLIDPFEVPPTGLLVMISVLGNGMQHGLKIFLEQFLASLLLGILVFSLRQALFLGPASYQLIFVNLFIAICIYYVFLLLKRIELMKKEAEQLARQDPLTRLYNRNAFMQAASHLLSLHERKNIPMVLMFADLDDFKQVNDCLGHAFGDKVLRFFARLTGELLRKTDIVARYGGDEFVFMLVDMTVEEAEKVALRLRREFLLWTNEHNVNMGVSFGLAAVPDGTVGLDRLLRHADEALYCSKACKDTREIVIAPPLEPVPPEKISGFHLYNKKT